MLRNAFILGSSSIIATCSPQTNPAIIHAKNSATSVEKAALLENCANPSVKNCTPSNFDAHLQLTAVSLNNINCVTSPSSILTLTGTINYGKISQPLWTTSSGTSSAAAFTFTAGNLTLTPPSSGEIVLRGLTASQDSLTLTMSAKIGTTEIITNKVVSVPASTLMNSLQGDFPVIDSNSPTAAVTQSASTGNLNAGFSSTGPASSTGSGYTNNGAALGQSQNSPLSTGTQSSVNGAQQRSNGSSGGSSTLSNQGANPLQNTANQGITTTQNTANQGVNTVQNTVNQATNTTQNTANQAANTTQNTANQATNTTQNTANQAANTTQNTVDQTTNTTQNTAEQSANTFTSTFGFLVTANSDSTACQATIKAKFSLSLSH